METEPRLASVDKASTDSALLLEDASESAVSVVICPRHWAASHSPRARRGCSEFRGADYESAALSRADRGVLGDCVKSDAVRLLRCSVSVNTKNGCRKTLQTSLLSTDQEQKNVLNILNISVFVSSGTEIALRRITCFWYLEAQQLLSAGEDQ